MSNMGLLFSVPMGRPSLFNFLIFDTAKWRSPSDPFSNQIYILRYLLSEAELGFTSFIWGSNFSSRTLFLSLVNTL